MTSRGVTTIPILYIDIDGTIYETQNEYENAINNNNHDVEESRIRLANILRTRKQQQQQQSKQQKQGTTSVSTGTSTTTATATAKGPSTTTNNVKRDDRKIKGKVTKAALSSTTTSNQITIIETDNIVSNTSVTNNISQEKQHSLVENVDSCSDNSSNDDEDDDIINDDDENDYEEDLVNNNEEYDNNNNNNGNDEYEWCSDDDDNDDEGDDDYNDDEDYDEDDSDVESNTNLLSQYHPQLHEQQQQVGMYTNDHHHNGSVSAMLQSDNHHHPTNMTSRSRMMLESNKQRYVTSLIQRDQQLKMNQSLARTAIRNMRPNRGNSTKVLPSQFVYQPSPADNAAARAIVHHTGSHYHMAGSKQYQRGVRVKGVVSRHSKQGAKIQAARMAKKNMYDAREDARGERTPNSNKNNNQMKQSKKKKKNKNQTTSNDKTE